MLIYCLLPKNLYVCSIYAKPNDLETDMLPCFKQRNIKHYMQKRYELSEHIYKFIDFCFTSKELFKVTYRLYCYREITIGVM